MMINRPLHQPDPRDPDNWPDDIRLDAGLAPKGSTDEQATAHSERNLLEQMLDRDLPSTHAQVATVVSDQATAIQVSREVAAALARDLIVALETEMLLLNQIVAEKVQARDLVLAEVQARLDAIEAEYMPKIDAQQAEINRLEPLIKTNVLTAQKTIKGETLIDCQYIKESHSWDSKLIDGFALAYPALEKARVKKAATTRFMPKKASKQ